MSKKKILYKFPDYLYRNVELHKPENEFFIRCAHKELSFTVIIKVKTCDDDVSKDAVAGPALIIPDRLVCV